jgi:hypothetical protein
MPRLQPPPGYVTAKEAARRLNVSDGLISRYVQQGKLKRYGPPERQHKFYKISEIEALLASERFLYMPGQWRNNPVLTFEIATEADMPAIFEISRGTFDMPMTPALAEIRREWLRKEPEIYHVVRDQAGTIVAYACLPAMSEQVIGRFIRDELEGEDILADDIQRFVPGKPLHIYIMAMAVDPQYSQAQKHEYGAVLVRGLFAFLLDLAQRGVELETITARTYKPDGLRMLRKLGIPQLHSPVPDKSLFMVRIPDSGFPLFERYSELLVEWQQSHQEPDAST